MRLGISLRGLKNKFNELMGRDEEKKDNKKSSESLESKEETRFDDTSPTKSKKTTASTDLDNTKNGASSGSVNSGEVHVEGLGQTTPIGSAAPQTNPSTGSGPSMLSPNSSTKRSRRLPPPPLPQNFSDPKCQKWVIEKFLKGDLSKLIDEAKKKRLLDDSYNYNENIKCYGFDYPACKFLENVRVFWLKIAEIIYRKIEEIPSNDISYEIINFQNQIGNCLQKTEMQSLVSKDDFVNKSKEFLKAINEKIDGVSGEKLLEDKKSELIKSKEVVEKANEKANEKAASLESKKSEIITKESNRFNALVDKYYKVTGTNYKIENNNMSKFYNSISDFWSKCVKEELKITDSKRADKLNSAMINIDKEILKNGNKLDEIPDDERLVSLEEALDQKFNIIGRVVLYLEKRKNKENEKGFFGKLFGKSKKSDDETKSDESNKSKEELKEEKKQKKEKLNNQKRLKKCFEDMGKYFVKHKDAVSATGLRKLVKNNDIDTYIEWNNGLRILLARNSISFNKELLMSALFISFIDLGDKESVIAACDGLKAGGIKSTDPESFEGKATSIRKAIKGKCATLNMANDPQAKANLRNDIKSLCMKYFGLDMSTLTNIGNIFGN